MTRAELEARRARPMQAIEAFAALAPGISVWDPFPVLCPGATCAAFRDGKPLFIDGDHLSKYGDAVLLPAFLAHLGRLDPAGNRQASALIQ